MQIHEVTNPGILRSIGQDIAGAVKEPFQKASAVLNTPGAMTTARGYGQAIDSVEQQKAQQNLAAYQQQKAQQTAQQTAQRAQQLAQQWLQVLKSKKPSPRLKSAPTPIPPTGQYATKPTPSGQVYGSNYPVRYRPPPAQPGQLPAPVAEQDEPIRGNVAGKPSTAEYEKLQQRIAAAGGTATPPAPEPAPAQPTAQAKTGFAAVAGPTAKGGTVRNQVTAKPKTILTGSRAKEFQAWANSQLTSRIPGTNQTLTLDTVRKDPKTRQLLNDLMVKIITNPQDPKPVEQYFTTAMQAMQKISAEMKQSMPGTVATPMSTGDNPLSRVISDRQFQDIKNMAQNPMAARAIKQALGIR
jgi:hypothetical protein